MPAIGRVAAMLATGAVMALLLLSGADKFLNLERFSHSLSTWELVPSAVARVAVVAVPAIEVAMPLAWFLRAGSRRVLALAVCLLLVAYTAVLVGHLLTARAPDCDCLGLITRHFQALSEARIAAIRNAVLIGLCVPGFVVKETRPLPAGATINSANGPDDGARSLVRRRPAPRAFSIVETLVVVAAVALLLAITLPALRLARGATRETVSLSNLRQHAGVFSMYNTDWNESYPEFCDTGAYSTDIWIRSLGITLTLPYFNQHARWNWLLADDYYDSQFAHESFYDPAGEPPSSAADYYYGCVFVTDPAYYRETTRLAGTSQWRGTARHEVLWPNQKVLLSRTGFIYGGNEEWTPAKRALYALGDGSAHTRPASEAIGRGYRYGDGDHPGSIHPADMHFYLHTIDGVRGRDLSP